MIAEVMVWGMALVNIFGQLLRLWFVDFLIILGLAAVVVDALFGGEA